MSSDLDLITIGESLIELSADTKLADADTLTKYYGGDTLAVAVSAQRMGSKVGYVTKIGDDYFKDYLIESWQNEGLDISKTTVIKGFNGIYFVSRPENEKKEYSYYRKKTAACNLNVNDIDKDYILSSKAVYSSGITQSLSINAKEVVKEVFKIAKENGVLVAYDPNFTEEIWNVEEAKEALLEVIEYVDILFMNTTVDGKELITKSLNDVIKYFWEKGVKTVIIKSSQEQGYYIGKDGEIVFINFYNTNDIKDTTCAGDAFNGAYIHEILKGSSYLEAGKFAAIVAGLQSQNVGAIKSIPYKETVYKIFKGTNE